MVAAGTLVERDRGRFRFTQRDACFRIQPRPPPFYGSSDSPSLPDLGHYTTAASTLNHTVVRIFGKSFEGDESGERVVERVDGEWDKGEGRRERVQGLCTASRGRENVQSFDVDFGACTGVYLFSSADKGKAWNNRIRARRRPITFVSSFFQAANVAYRPSNAAERLVVKSRRHPVDSHPPNEHSKSKLTIVTITAEPEKLRT
ncbi:hypothetical protein V1478_013087 [Vespula squamosa]|uniref:Uncharacterized protein n=1 Tax=Vespula squamosa TaxID=30214 RepID=A0ABD2A9Y5_VESSQ